MCGIFGVIGKTLDVSKLTYFGLYALQHRGQESAGIAVVNQHNEIDYHKGMGLTSQVFTDNILKNLQGQLAVGHTRYSTTGESSIQNAQPVLVKLPNGEQIVIVHNGNLVNVLQLRDELAAEGHEFTMSSDTELIGLLIAKHFDGNLEETLKIITKKIKGAFSLVILTQDKIWAMRDPYGIWPLSIGSIEGKGMVVASETCGLDIVDAKFVRDVEKGEIISIDKNNQLTSSIYNSDKRSALCFFELIYFSRPDSKLMGHTVYSVRSKMGKQLFKEHPCEADMVIAVPDSGIAAAIGYAEASGLPYEEGLIKNRYVGRTFISPSPEMRKMGVRMKLNPLKEVIDGKRIVVVDDSIVRGTTSGQIIKLLRDCGAKEVHFRVSSPPIISHCFYGIDTASKDELIGSRMSIDEIKDQLKADSLGYLSIDGMMKAMGESKDKFCLACMDKNYPIPVPKDEERLKLVFCETIDDDK